MAISNHERVGKALELLREGLRPFVERELKTYHGDRWASEVKEVLTDTRLGGGKGDAMQDVAVQLVLMDRTWGTSFERPLERRNVASSTNCSTCVIDGRIKILSLATMPIGHSTLCHDF
jgi:hypothetical protein